MPAILPPDCKLVHQGIMFNIFQCPQKQFDGTTKTFEYCVRNDSVTVFGFIDPQTIIITEQNQPGRPTFFDFPGGRVNPGETHEQAARREFEEETGYRIGRIKPIWNNHFLGSTRFEKSLFLATDRNPDPSSKKLDSGEQVKIIIEPWNKIIGRCHKYELRQLDGMLCILNIVYDPNSHQELVEWLNNK